MIVMMKFDGADDLQLRIAGGHFKRVDGSVPLAIGDRTNPPPAILCLQNMASSSKHQQEDDDSKQESDQDLQQHAS